MSNARSSRSHTILSLYLTRKRDEGNITSKILLVDLAGSERAEFSTTKKLLAEGADINKSLVSLGNVISSLAERASYIPYRDSALTWLLKDSIGGNSSTAIIITSSPASKCYAQTLNSLRFSQRARLVENIQTVNFTSFTNENSISNLGFIKMSNEIKKDISRLSNIIKSAQSNGGILRGFTPRNSWNRLINAIEGWNHHHHTEERKKLTRTQSETTTTSTMTTTSSLTDVMVQTIMDKSDNLHSNNETNPLVNTQSAPSSPSKVSNIEKLASNNAASSVKCLTWQQEEIKQLPNFSDSSPEEEQLPDLHSPSHLSSSCEVQNINYDFPVFFPVTNNLQLESRMAEKNKTIPPFEPRKEKINPIIVTNETDNSPVISRTPTRAIDRENPEAVPFSEEFRLLNPVYVSPFESTDEDDVLPVSEFISQPKYRAVESKNIINDFDFTSPEEALFFSETVSSSSSYESLTIDPSREIPRIKIVQHTDIEFKEGKIGQINLNELLEQRKRRCTASELYDTDGGVIYDYDDLVSNIDYPEEIIPRDFSGNTKYKNYFAKEYQQMESIGQKIKNLKSLADNYKMVQPYLKQISDLDKEDFTKSDKKLDMEIERCSGWNVNKELQKVKRDFHDINKILNKDRVQQMSRQSTSSNLLQKKKDTSSEESRRGDSTTGSSTSSSFRSFESSYGSSITGAGKKNFQQHQPLQRMSSLVSSSTNSSSINSITREGVFSNTNLWGSGAGVVGSSRVVAGAGSSKFDQYFQPISSSNAANTSTSTANEPNSLKKKPPPQSYQPPPSYCYQSSSSSELPQIQQHQSHFWPASQQSYFQSKTKPHLASSSFSSSRGLVSSKSYDQPSISSYNSLDYSSSSNYNKKPSHSTLSRDLSIDADYLYKNYPEQRLSSNESTSLSSECALPSSYSRRLQQQQQPSSSSSSSAFLSKKLQKSRRHDVFNC